MNVDRSRLRAPVEHLGVLFEPAPLQLHRWLSDVATSPHESADAVFLGRPLSAWRAELHAELRLKPPVLLTGHQAEFFHAGVLAKNFAAGALAASHQGSAAFVLVDSDVPKRASLRVPEITRAGLRAVELAIPALQAGTPMQFQPPAPRSSWLDFFTAAAGRLERFEGSALSEFSRAWLSDAEEIGFCDGFERGRMAVEAAVTAISLPGISVSRLCQTSAFHAFLGQVILHAKRFARCHNSARDSYRARHKVRNAQRPVPALAISEDRCELLFWAVKRGARRRRVWVRPRGDAIDLFVESDLIATLSADDLSEAARLQSKLTSAGTEWQIRPRALSLSAFMRLFVADLFIHGIGGAKYDEITDAMIQEFLGTPAPPYCCVTATAYLPLPAFGTSQDELRASRRRERDFRHNPQRYVPVGKDGLRDLDQLIGEVRRLRAEQAPRSARRAAHQALAALKQQMAEEGSEMLARLAQETAEAQGEVATDAIARDREYFFGLHPRSALAALWTRITHELGG